MNKAVIPVIIILAVGVPTAYGITITLGGDPVIINGILDLMNNRITNVGTPTNPSDAATKAYFDLAPSTDTLASLGCTDNQIAEFVGSVWTCGVDVDTDTVPWNSRIPQSTTLIIIDSAVDVGEDNSITIGTDGLPVISYRDGTNEDLKVAHCGNASCSSGNTFTTVDNAAGVGSDTSIAIGTDGFPVISYHDTTNGDLKVAHCGDIDCAENTNVNTLTTVDVGGNAGADVVGQFTSITIGIDGFPVISYRDGTNEDLKVAHCTSIDCTAVDTPTTIDTVLSAGSDTSITIGTDGLPVISYLDGVSSNLKVAHCGDIDCAENTNVNTLTIVDNTAAVGFESSITIGTDGLPVISYQDSTNGDLKVAHCGDIDCAENTNVNTLTIVDNAVNVGSESSITIGTDGFPVISYRDGQSNDLKVAHCTNTSCSTSTITTVDFAVDLNDATSIAIGTDGLPVISYFDDFGLDLKVTKCTNPNCLNNWIRR